MKQLLQSRLDQLMIHNLKLSKLNQIFEKTLHKWPYVKNRSKCYVINTSIKERVSVTCKLIKSKLKCYWRGQRLVVKFFKTQQVAKFIACMTFQEVADSNL